MPGLSLYPAPQCCRDSFVLISHPPKEPFHVMETAERGSSIVAIPYEQLTCLLEEYKHDLGLENWTIGLAIRRSLELGDRHGHVSLLEKKTQAFIRLLDPVDADPLELVAYDMEIALVHELCHCALAPFIYVDEGSHEDIVQEQAINRMSISIVSAKRSLRAAEDRIRQLESRDNQALPRRKAA